MTTDADNIIGKVLREIADKVIKKILADELD